jgi:TnpA family transposase
MNILPTVPFRTASLFRQSRAVLNNILSGRTLISRFQYFIETTEWDEKYLCHKVIDKICLGVIIFSIIYFCFRPGAYLTGIIFLNYG